MERLWNSNSPLSPNECPRASLSTRAREEVEDDDERDRRREPGKGNTGIATAERLRRDGHDEIEDDRGGERAEPVVGHVERLDEPGVALLQPLGDVLYDDDERDEHRRQQDRRRHDDAGREVVRLVAVRDDDEELREPGEPGEEQREAPVPRRHTVLGDRDDEGRRRGDVHGEEVELRRPREAGGRLVRSGVGGRRHGDGRWRCLMASSAQPEARDSPRRGSPLHALRQGPSARVPSNEGS